MTKELVLGVSVVGERRAYLGSMVTAAGGTVEDDFRGRPIRLHFDLETATFGWDVPDDAQVDEAYWPAGKPFLPDTGIWQPSGS